MVRNQSLILGMTLMVGGWALGMTPPQLVRGNSNSILTLVEVPLSTVLPIASGSSPATSISSNDSPKSGAIPHNSKEPAESDGPQRNVPAPLPQKPAVLVPEIPDKDNGQAVVSYKSKIEETQGLLRTINERQLTKEQHDTFISIHSFLEKAQEAYSQDDLSMALNLVEKAHTLTKEIVHSSKQQ